MSNELPDDLEVMTPGQMLKEAREKRGLSVENVAQRLNLRITLINEIENDKTNDKNTTFVRGYLKSYAKLVGLSEKDVLTGIAHLNSAQQMSVELQSFSNEAKNKNSDSKLMAFTYLVMALLIVSMVIWWAQLEDSSSVDEVEETVPELLEDGEILEDKGALSPQQSLPKPLDGEGASSVIQEEQAEIGLKAKLSPSKESDNLNQASVETKQVQASELINSNKLKASEAVEPTASEQMTAEKSTLEFTFKRKIWVQVKDASGRKIAYGTKAAGRVMKLTGKPPFKVIVGTTKGLSIRYNGKVVDLGRFDPSQFAKFQLPL